MPAHSLSLAPPDRRHWLGLPAPAKINLFLHVVGRRADGYHEIQSVFVPIGLCDTLDLCARSDDRIVRSGDLTGPQHEDLAVRAALALRAFAASWRADPELLRLGVTLKVEKRIPVGAGLGGGSSDAATTLIGLNRLWNLGLTRAQLGEIGLQLGADVPFFLGPGPAFVEGIGEHCTPLALPPVWLVVVFPQVHVSTAQIFADPKLTRDRKRTTIAGFSAELGGGKMWSVGAQAPGAVGVSLPASGMSGGPAAAAPPDADLVNDLEPVACRRYPEVDAALALLRRHGSARMSGSGSAVFAALADEAQARALVDKLRPDLPPAWPVWIAPGLAELPLSPW
jgi:4-diphosphocytidyl-2-C-methyl-D-erythritol kinase